MRKRHDCKNCKMGKFRCYSPTKRGYGFLALHIGDNVQITEKNNAITISLIDEKKERLIAKARGISKKCVLETISSINKKAMQSVF